MAMQSLLSIMEASDRQGLEVLERNKMGPSPLGAVGNLRFSAEQGGTPHASWCGRVWTTAAHAAGTLALALTCPPDQAWVQHMSVVRAYVNSRCLGDLLGSLTVRPDDSKGHSMIVDALTKLSSRSNNDPTKLVGWRHTLSTYIGELKDADIKALRSGVLGSQSARQRVLNQISRHENDPSRQLASQVLGRIEKELHRRLTRGSAGEDARPGRQGARHPGKGTSNDSSVT